MFNFRLIFTIAVMFSLTGCFTAVVGGTAVATNSINDERKIGAQFDDATLTAKIDARLIAEKDMPSRWVSVQVIEGNATLTGHLPSQSHIDRALYITKSIGGVRSVHSELLVGEPKIKGMVSDTWITTKVKTLLLNDEQVSGLTIKVETVEGKVYLQGIVEDFVQRQRAKDIVNTVDGVTAIIDLMQVAQK